MTHIGAYYSAFRDQTITVQYTGSGSYWVAGEGFHAFSCTEAYLTSHILGYNKYAKLEA